MKDLISDKFVKDLKRIQSDFDKSLNVNKISSSKIKKYNIIKNSFNNFLKLISQTLFRNTFNIFLKYLEKMYFEYDNIFNALSAENQKYKKINKDLNEKKDRKDKNLKDLQNIMAEKQNKLKDIEQKFITLLNMINKNNNLKDCYTSLNKDFTLKAKSIEEREIISTIEEFVQELKKVKII